MVVQHVLEEEAAAVHVDAVVLVAVEEEVDRETSVAVGQSTSRPRPTNLPFGVAVLGGWKAALVVEVDSEAGAVDFGAEEVPLAAPEEAR